MADLRVTPASDGARRLTPVASEGRRQQDEHQQQGEGERRHSPPGAEELAVALSGEGRASMQARYEQDADGNPLIRIVDAERGETIAVLTPEELQELAAQTGLPPGLLIRTTS